MTPAPTMLPRAILFDLDDTIVAYDAASQGCWQEACERHFGRISGTTLDQLCAEIQRQSEWFWSDSERFRQGRLNLAAARQQVVAGAFEALGVSNPDAARDIAVLRTELHEARIAPFPGAIAVLQRLRAMSIRLGLVTNGSAEKQRAKINRYQLAPIFSSIVVEGEFGCGKPDERVFRHALAQIEADPVDVWMVGDNLRHDIAPAQALGMIGIWHDFRGAGLPPDAPCQPVRVIRQLAELLW